MKAKPIKEEDHEQDKWYAKAEKIESVKELTEFVTELTTKYQHDYGTICHAVAAAGLAAMRTVDRAPCGGITGFQAGCILWSVIEKWGVFDKGPKKMVCYANMLFPQYEDKFDKTINTETWEYLMKEAKQKLAESNGHTPPDVKKHWESVAAGKVPFGYRVYSE